MSAAQSEAAVARVVAKHNDLGEDFAAYAVLALGMLGHAEPDVLNFILDQADQAAAQ